MIAVPVAVSEIAGRFVREDQRRAAHQRPRDRDTLLLAARQLRGIVSGPVTEADRAKFRFGASECIVLACQLQRNRDIFERGHRRQQVECLQHDADPSAPCDGKCVLVQHGEVEAGNGDGTAARTLQPGKHRHQRGFPRPRRPE